MKIGIKVAIGFVLGCIAGVAASNKYFKDKYQAISDEQIDAMKVACRRRIRKAAMKKESEKISSDAGYDSVKEEPKEEKKDAPNDLKKRRKREPVDYTKYSAKILKAKEEDGQTRVIKWAKDLQEDMDQEELMEDANKEYQNVINTEPYIINFDEFDAGVKGFEQRTLTYFDEDDTLVDEEEDPIVDIEATVGDALTQFGADGAAKDTVYVRNGYKHTDYEIVRSKLSYKRDVLGLDD